jgi:hypothetical protein
MIRDLVAAGVALLLLIVAASLGTTLTVYRKRRQQNREHERLLGRTIVAEIPTDDGLVLFTEDDWQFHYGTQTVDKAAIAAVRLLINGVPIATCASKRHAANGRHQPRDAERGDGAPAKQDRGTGPPGVIEEDRPEGIARDRWDVAIECGDGTTLVECGAIRERISQELARAAFDAVKRDIERRDDAA